MWVAKFEAGEFDPEAEAASLITDYEARIAALERLVGRQALELEFLKGALKAARPPRNGPTSVIAARPLEVKLESSLTCSFIDHV